jgi:glucose-6-phosphate 1-dehydrogenase
MKNSVHRVAGEALNPEQIQELRSLAAMPDAEIDFSDIPAKPYEQRTKPALEEHTVTLRLDPEVAVWLETTAQQQPEQINLLFKQVARRKSLRSASGVLEKAS